MEYVFKAKGHLNVSSTHRTTFEVTMDKDIGRNADCIIGVASNVSVKDIPKSIKDAIANDATVIKIVLETENAVDMIEGRGHHLLTLDHPTDIVCRKSDYVCSRTLMIKSDKAAVDLDPLLINDLKNQKSLKVKIIVES
ncbi:MAG: DUF371 domain-containing protein [Methanomicrobiales archaeon]